MDLGRSEWSQNSARPTPTGSQSDSDETAWLVPRSTSASAPASWHPQNQVGRQDISYLGLSRQASSRSHSSVVNDGGDAKQLAQTATLRGTRSLTDFQSSTESTDDVQSLNFSYLGGGVPSEAPRHPETLDSDLTSQREGESQDHDHDGNASSPPTTNNSLEHDLRAAFRMSEEQERLKFLPLDQLDRIITADRVKRELQKHNIVLIRDLDHYTGQIWGVTKSPSATSRRKIFAILVLLQKVAAILDFIEDGLYDKDLPFILTEGPAPGYSQLSRKIKGGATEPIAFCQDPNAWPTHLLECFNNYQCQLLAPYFELSTKSKPRVNHYNLKSNIILPFIEVDKENASAHRGAFGDVWRVKIHPAHHNCYLPSPDQSGNPSYAVKRLRLNDKDAFEAEVSTLRRLGDKDHLHLIRLLVTYSYRDEFYLLFPWADGGNLQDLWKDGYPNPTIPPRDERLAQWLSRQILGIVEGLGVIHTSEIKPFYRGANLSPMDDKRKYGRHGDLKPENILWFKTYHSDDKACFMGLLKISDFGMTSFHDSQTRSMLEARSIGGSPTYRAPEYDIKKHVSQKYDIWTLGCVLIEFVTWYLLGWEGVDSFAKSRAADDNQEIKDIKLDVFFNLEHPGNNGPSSYRARMKKAVVDHFNYLRERPDCTDFILELLDFIEMDLLRMEPDKRAKIDDIVAKVKSFHQLCETDIRYCTDRIKTIPTRARTDLSELEASNLSYSPEMQERLRPTVVNRGGDGKAEPGSRRELNDLGTDRTETKRGRTSTQKGKERMATVKEASITPEHSMHESQQPLSEITANRAAERNDQPGQSGASMGLFAQAEVVPELDRKLHGFQRGEGLRHGQAGAKGHQPDTTPDIGPPQQPEIAGSVFPPIIVSMACPDQLPTFPPVPTQEQRIQGLPLARDDDTAEEDGATSTATTTTIQDPIDTAQTIQPPEVDSSTAEPGTADSQAAETPVVNHRLLSKPHADPSPSSSFQTIDALVDESGSHPQEGEQRRSHEADARRAVQQAWNAPPSATQLAGSGGSVALAGCEQVVGKPTADPLTDQRTSFRNLLRSLLCCVASPRQ